MFSAIDDPKRMIVKYNCPLLALVIRWPVLFAVHLHRVKDAPPAELELEREAQSKCNIRRDTERVVEEETTLV